MRRARNFPHRRLSIGSACRLLCWNRANTILLLMCCGLSESKLRLEEALTTWARWQVRQQSGAQATSFLTSGSLELDTELLAKCGLAVWKERTKRKRRDSAPSGNGVAAALGAADAAASSADVASAQQQPYEAEHDVPEYERAIFHAMVQPKGDAGGESVTGLFGLLSADGSTASVAAAASAATAAAAAAATLGTPGSASGSAGGGPPAKRIRVSGGRCWNCGSYAHELAACPRPRDGGRISASRKDFMDAREARHGGGGGGAEHGRRPPGRYFEEPTSAGARTCKER